MLDFSTKNWGDCKLEPSMCLRHNYKSIGLRLFKFVDISTHASHFGH